MHGLRRRLPSLNHLFAVEAVGRHLSFTLAAEELGISQPAVSNAIRTTEDALGFALFVRDRRGLRFTPKGRVFFTEAKTLLDQMSEVVQSLVGETGGAVLRACFSSSFVSLWLLPRVPGFLKLYPDIALDLSESDSDMVDLGARKLDFSARLGDGRWDNVKSSLLVRESVGVVASPEYLARNPGLSDLGMLAQADLIHVNEPRRNRIGWRDWFHQMGARSARPKVSLTVSDYHSAIDAALMGQGAALGWEHLVGGKVEQGHLAWIGAHRVHTGMGIYLVEPLREAQAEHDRFRDWIIGHFA